MSKVVVIYQSKYGATKKYAQWLSEELACDVIETKKASIEKVMEYETIILGGGIYASGIAGLSFIKKNYPKLKDKKIAVFAVGASPYNEKAVNAIKDHNFKDSFKDMPFFYCRGAWDEEKMTWTDKVLCNMLKKAVSKKDPAGYEPWESALMEAMGSKCDWTEKESLKPIIEFVQGS